MALHNLRVIKCQNCGQQMTFLRKILLRSETFQTPSIIPLVGMNSSERPIVAEIFMCFKCGKIDFFGPDEKDESSQLKILYGAVPKSTLIKCNKCGKTIATGSKKCPFCGDEQPFL